MLATFWRRYKERHKIRNDAGLAELLDILSFSIGSLTNPKKLSDTFKSVKQVSFHPDTISNYLEYLVDSYLISQSKRYDIKGYRNRTTIRSPLQSSIHGKHNASEIGRTVKG